MLFRRTLQTFMLVSALVVFHPSVAAEYRIVGSKRCAICHQGGGNGNIFGRWQRGPHARAFAALQTPRARQIRKKHGLPHTPCLQCHTTAGALNRTLGTEPGTQEGVGCEACHGAGSGYSHLVIMQDRRKALAKGLKPGNYTQCERCHNGQCPADKPMDPVQGWKRIGHGNPSQPKGDNR